MRRGAPRGRGFLGSQPRLAFLPITQFCSRTICFLDVSLERGLIPEASVNALQDIALVKPDPRPRANHTDRHK